MPERKVRAGDRFDFGASVSPSPARWQAQGANITINGFGDKAAIEKERAGIETDFKGQGGLFRPDMSKGR